MKNTIRLIWIFVIILSLTGCNMLFSESNVSQDVTQMKDAKDGIVYYKGDITSDLLIESQFIKQTDDIIYLEVVREDFQKVTNESGHSSYEWVQTGKEEYAPDSLILNGQSIPFKGTGVSNILVPVQVSIDRMKDLVEEEFVDQLNGPYIQVEGDLRYSVNVIYRSSIKGVKGLVEDKQFILNEETAVEIVGTIN